MYVFLRLTSHHCIIWPSAMLLGSDYLCLGKKKKKGICRLCVETDFLKEILKIPPILIVFFCIWNNLIFSRNKRSLEWDLYEAWFWKVSTFGCQSWTKLPETKHWSLQGRGLVATQQESWLTQQSMVYGVRGSHYQKNHLWVLFKSAFVWFCHFRLSLDWWIECIWRRLAAVLKLTFLVHVLMWASGKGALDLVL